MPTPEDVQHKKDLLKVYRDRLKHDLYEKVVMGHPTPYRIARDISEAQNNILHIKSVLRGWGVEVEDHPDDDDPDIPNNQFTQSEARPTNHTLVETQEEDIPHNNKASSSQNSSKEKSIDFEDSIEWEKLEFKSNLLIVTKPKVRITFHMPYAFEDAKCEVEFSSPGLHRVAISLNHTDILGQLMTGLDTSPDSGARRFINKADKDLFKAQLGQVQIILQQAEALDLCACIDIVCGKYKKRIMEAENLLETGNFPLVREEDTPGMGVLLLSVRPELWKLICKFASEFDYSKDDSKWHMFDGRGDWIRICSKGRGGAFPDNAIIYGDKGGGGFSDNYVHLIYAIPGWHLERTEEIYGDWQNDVGAHGIWTATHTKNWLLNEFIPTVRQHYCGTSRSDSDSVCDSPEIFDDIPQDLTNQTREELEQVTQPNQLSTFIDDLHFWFYLSKLNIKSLIVIDFFEAFLELAEDVEPSTVNTDYIWRKLRSLSITPSELRYIDECEISKWSYSDIPQYISDYINHLRQTDFVPYGDIELIFRVLGAIVEGKFARINQSRLNTLKKYMIPLWREGNFENRYIFHNRQNI